VSDSNQVRVGGRDVHLRAYLDRFLFPPEVHQQKVSALSGGERNRVLLARLLLEDFNLLVLDEPTNDLDLDTLRILEGALGVFPGCILVVTHDRYLLDKLATSLLVFEEGGRIRRHHGSWDAYLARREEARSVRAALEALPEEQRRTIELAYFGGFSHSQIAELLDEPIGTVKGRMRLGLDKLRRQLAEGYAAGGFA
jgi:ABC transport system ATP-binding/permease protein